MSKAKQELAQEEEKFRNTIKNYKQLSYADPMELAKQILVEQQRAAITIQVKYYIMIKINRMLGNIIKKRLKVKLKLKMICEYFVRRNSIKNRIAQFVK